MKKESIAIIAAMAVVSFCARGQDVNATLNQWNVITSGDLKAVGSDIEGTAYVGGNVTVPNAFQVGTHSTVSTTDTSLAVVGNIVGGGDIHIEKGSVVMGGSVQDGRNVIMNSGGTISQNGSAALPPSPVQTVTSASLLWSTLADNGSTSLNAANQLNFNCGSGPLAVFNITANQMFDPSYHGFNLILSSGTKDVIINIEGSSVNWNTGDFFGSFQTEASHVVFNFFDATSVYLHNVVYGYVVAPNADVTEANNFTVGVMGKNVTIGSEAHLPAWNGNVPSGNVPEPATWISGAAALGMLTVGLFRSRTGSKKADQ
jgi:choice-of-anchor A domain-containing protein